MKGLITLFLIITQVSYGQNHCKLSGHLIDDITLENIAGAVIQIDLHNRSITDSNGVFEYTLPAGDYQLNINHLSYKDRQTNIKLLRDTNIVYSMESNAYDLNELTVRPSVETKGISGMLAGRIELDMEALKVMPKFLGNNDPFKILQLTPGVKTSNDGESGMFIRGGENGHNLILWNDAPIYNASHLLGTFSVFNTGHVEKFKLLKSNIGAEYGGRLSAILSVESPEKIPDKISINGNVGLIAAQVTLALPIRKKHAFYLSARKTYLGLFLKPLINATTAGKRSDAPFDYDFMDVNFTYIANPTSKDKIILNGYWGQDQLEMSEPAYSARGDMKWSNLAASLQWKRDLNSRAKMKHSLFTSRYTNDVNMKQGEIDINLPSSILDIGYRNSFEFNLGKHTLKAGVDYTYHSIAPQIPRVDLDAFEIGNHTIAKFHTHEFALYISDNIHFTGNFWAEVGIRYSANIQSGKYDDLIYNSQGTLLDSIHYKKGEIVNYRQGWEPRVNLNYNLPRKGLLQFSYNRIYQYVNLVSISGVGLPTDFWVPASKNITPQRTDNFSIGYFQSFSQNMYELSLEGYYRNMTGLIEYNNTIVNLINQKYILEQSLLFGSGNAYGAEFMLKKNGGKWNGWISYALGWSNRNFPDIDNGSTFPAKHDRRHDLSVVINYTLSKKWDFSTVFVFATGSAYTEPIGLQLIGGNPVKEYGPYNGARLPNYHRLDISVNYWFFKEKHRESGLNLSIYNMYKAQNPLYIFVVPNTQNDKIVIERKYKQFYDIIPSISWIFKF